MNLGLFAVAILGILATTELGSADVYPRYLLGLPVESPLGVQLMSYPYGGRLAPVIESAPRYAHIQPAFSPAAEFYRNDQPLIVMARPRHNSNSLSNYAGIQNPILQLIRQFRAGGGQGLAKTAGRPPPRQRKPSPAIDYSLISPFGQTSRPFAFGPLVESTKRLAKATPQFLRDIVQQIEPADISIVRLPRKIGKILSEKLQHPPRPFAETEVRPRGPRVLLDGSAEKPAAQSMLWLGHNGLCILIFSR
jgi:hypothetical protein